jgi:hypothetical protein
MTFKRNTEIEIGSHNLHLAEGGQYLVEDMWTLN